MNSRLTHLFACLTGGLAAAVLGPVHPAAGQGLPSWQPRTICLKDSATGQCVLLERRARNVVAASWDVLPKAVRDTCLARFAPPLEPSWRILADCLEIEGRRALTRAREKREARELALLERRAAEEKAARRQREARAAAERERVQKEEASFMALLAEQRRADARKQAAVRKRRAAADTCQASLKQVQSSGTIQFAFNSAALVEANGSPLLDRLAAVAANCEGQLNITVEGHTDAVGTEAGNLRLSQERAETVVRHLVGKGVSNDRISAKGFGSSRPVAANDTPAGRARNRRIEFKVE